MQKNIKHYQILEKIDKGSYAKVKRVLNTLDQKQYAVKIFDKFLLMKKKKIIKGSYISDF